MDVLAAVLAEREACARLAEQYADEDGIGEEIAFLIRDRRYVHFERGKLKVRDLRVGDEVQVMFTHRRSGSGSTAPMEVVELLPEAIKFKSLRRDELARDQDRFGGMTLLQMVPEEIEIKRTQLHGRMWRVTRKREAADAA